MWIKDNERRHTLSLVKKDAAKETFKLRKLANKRKMQDKTSSR